MQRIYFSGVVEIEIENKIQINIDNLVMLRSIKDMKKVQKTSQSLIDKIKI